MLDPVARGGDVVFRGAVVPGVRDAVVGAGTAEAAAIRAPAESTAAAPGTALDEALGAPAQPVTAAIARQHIPARLRSSPPRPRIDPMPHDASSSR
jgi:hypothetical protein